MTPLPLDPFDLHRFVAAQEGGVFERALEELRRGRKQSHWMWFIFPQLAGLGSSSMAQRYALRDLAEARAYAAHPLLGPRLLQGCEALQQVEGRSALKILGSPDDAKLRSSMTLFALAAGDTASPFDTILAKYFGGEPDPRTRELLAAEADG